MTITMLRHGMTRGNIERRYVGATDVPLAPEGIRQAEQARKDGALPLVYVTPLRRTQQTAAILFPGARQQVVDGLREMNFGHFEGRTYEELENDREFIDWNLDGGLQPSPGGEGRLGFGIRVREALRQLVDAARQSGEQSITLVAHGGTIMALMSVHALPQRHWHDYWLDNLEGYRVTLPEGPWGEDSRFLCYEKVSVAAQDPEGHEG